MMNGKARLDGFHNWDGARLDECVHHGLIMLEDKLEQEVGDNESQ